MAIRFENSMQRASNELTVLDTTDSIVSDPINLNGRIRRVVLDVPALTGSDTASLTIKDEDGLVVYTETGIAAGTTLNDPVDLAVAGEHTFEITTSGTQDADRDFRLVIINQRT